jgi:hypothetical protein
VQPFPDAVAVLALQNGPDAIRLASGEAQLDLVGYGALNNPAYYELEPAQDAAAGFSLCRVPDGEDTDDNRSDFAALLPNPGAYNVPRRDLSINPDPLLVRVVEADAIAPVSCFVRNEGIHAIPANAFTTELWDSSRYDVRLLGTIPGCALDPGEQVNIEVQAVLPRGYHWLRGRLRLSGDERSRNDSIEFVMRAGTPPVLISEVMSYPANGSPQYVELFNGGSEEADCAGWFIRDAAHAPVPFPPLAIAPRGYSALTPDRSQLLSTFPAAGEGTIVQVDGSWPYFNHTGSGQYADSVEISDMFGFVVDRIAYPPQESTLRGRSIERVDLYPGNGKHTWILSSSPYGGTPGARNSVFRESPPSGGSIACSPNPFSLRDEVLLIELSTAEDVERVVVSVYDLSGMRLHEVGASARTPALFVWDGRGRNGSFVGPGIYLVVCEKFFRDGGKGVERVVVGCGEKRFGGK